MMEWVALAGFAGIGVVCVALVGAWAVQMERAGRDMAIPEWMLDRHLGPRRRFVVRSGEKVVPFPELRRTRPTPSQEPKP